MPDLDFLDTPVLIHAVDRSQPQQQALAQRLVSDALAQGRGVISFQVVHETLYALTQRARRVLSDEGAARLLDGVLRPLWRVQPSAALYARALTLESRTGRSFGDCLIVAAALEAGCTRLLSAHFDHGQCIEGLRVDNPFRALGPGGRPSG